MKYVSLFERNKKGRIVKNESFTFNQMREKMIKNNRKYFMHWWYGENRRETLNLILNTFSELIDKDQEGNFSLDK